MTHSLPAPLELLNVAFESFKKRAGFFALLALIPSAFAFVISFSWTYALEWPQGKPFPEMAFTPAILALCLATLVMMVVAVWSQIAMIYGAGHETETSVQNAYVQSKPHFWSFIWLSIRLSVGVLLWMIVFIIPGIYKAVLWIFAPYELLLGGKSVGEAIKSSEAMVKGRWWAVFGRYVLVVVLMMVVVGIPSELLQGDAPMPTTANMVWETVASLVTGPVLLLYSYGLYRGLKK